MGQWTIYTSDTAREVAEECFTDSSWNVMLRDGDAAWDASNACEVDDVLKKMVAEGARSEALKESIRRRQNWADRCMDRLKDAGCAIRRDGGVMTISLASDATPAVLLEYVRQHGLEAIPVIWHSVAEMEDQRVGRIPIFFATVTSVRWWREPFRVAERFVVGRVDIDRWQDTWTANHVDMAWSHVHPTLRRAQNHAARLEDRRMDFDSRVAKENARIEKEDSKAIAEAFE